MNKWSYSCTHCGREQNKRFTKCPSCEQYCTHLDTYYTCDCGNKQLHSFICFKCNREMPKPPACYIATACYGDYEAKEVLVFRNFRDKVLLNSFLGKLFVMGYYRFSPFIALLLEKKIILNSIVKYVILNPIYKLLRNKYT